MAASDAKDDQTPNPDGTSPFSAPKVTLPKGGGALRGIGEKFAANPVTGTGTLTIPIALSPGRAGFGPQLALSYDSGSGNGPFGLGWSLSLPSITRKMDKGLPQYNDASDSDVFILSGAEDLVPILIQGTNGDWEREVVSPQAGYLITSYRPRVEGLFARIERWTRMSDGDTYWRSISKDNMTSFYGLTTASRISDPNDGGRIFSWLLCQTQDDKGNITIYEYLGEDSANVDETLANERNRSRSANRYLKRILYGNTPSLLVQPDLTQMSWLFEAVFDYGQGFYQEQPPDPLGRVFATASLTPNSVWPVRQDPFSHYRSCFEVRTYRLCRRVLMFHHFPNELSTKDYLVRTTAFTYDEGPIASFITGVTQSGFIRQNDGTYLKRSLPSLGLEYSQAQVQQDVQEIDPESLENLPANIDGARYRWLDLDGEGMPCVLAEQDDAWYYKRNLTPLSLAIAGVQAGLTASFETLTEVNRLPAFAHADAPHHQFMDLTGDGRLDCVVLDQPGAGFYERTRAAWRPFATLPSAPKVDWSDPNLRLIDIDGDGFNDILITEHDAFTYYPSLAAFGFDAPNRVPKAINEEKGPAIIFADSTESIFLADMSGDGLTDIVRIRNGEVCYWPNLGYGQFGSKVAMDQSPWFDSPDLFDQRRIRLADVDGSGVSDIIYLAQDGVQLYFNQSGNAWSAVELVADFPPVDNLAAIQALDLLGNGTACLVWSSSLPGDVGRSMRYIDLMGGEKPYLLVRSWNNLGAETRVSYAPSTAFYLADREAGQPWVTRLPFPVQVVERVDTYDQITGNRFVTRYAYHHGYYDGIEREFRGFGMVEQWDTESFADYFGAGEFTATADQELYVPPAHTKTWFHTGAYFGGRRISRFFDHEYFSGDPLATRLPDTALPDGLSGEEEREACRALKGRMLRQEIYADDASPEAANPYSVTENNFAITLLQPFAGNPHAAFYVNGRESVTYYYERNPADPRISHQLTLEVDPYGNITKSATIGYPRRAPAFPEEGQTLVTYTEADFFNAPNEPGFYRIGIPYDHRTYEITGLAASKNSLLAWSAVSSTIQSCTDIFYEVPPSTGFQRRLFERSRSLYYKDDLSGPLPLGNIESHALLYQTVKMVFTPGLITEAYGNRVDDNLLRNEGRYIKGADYKATGLFPSTDDDSLWWVPSGYVVFDATQFYLGVSFVDPFGNKSDVSYDSYSLMVVQTVDPLTNTIAAKYNYRTLQPYWITDQNGNRTGARFDELGMVVATAVMGKKGANEGDTLDEGSVEASPADDPTTKLEYDLFNWSTNSLPNYVHTLAREQHQLASTRWQESYGYSDGFARQIQTKSQVPAGLAPGRGPDGKLLHDASGNLVMVDTTPNIRWVGTARTVFDNKGNPVKKYEPFFSTTSGYEDEQDLVQWGVTPIIHYDPLGRVIQTDAPDGTFSKVEFDSWQQITSDANDTVLTSKWYSDRGSPDPSGPEPLDTQTRAAWLAAQDAGTPSVANLDVLGRTFLTIADNGPAEKYPTKLELDIQGNQLSVTDALNRAIITYDHDMLGSHLHQSSVDAGERWMLGNASGKPLRAWNSRGFQLRYVYDPLQRPNQIYVQPGAEKEILAECSVYGEALAGSQTQNLRGNIYQHYDEAGVATNVSFDFKGNLNASSRRLLQYKVPLNWSALATLTVPAQIAAVADPLLEKETFAASSTFDALNRLVTSTAPDGSVAHPIFNEANQLDQMSVNLRVGGTATAFVTGIDYNARGQRLLITYGNGAETDYTYDTDTFRLTELETKRASDAAVLQDLTYVYDPVGNITSIGDAAQETVYFSNQVVTGSSNYSYDAIYRLTSATGREHIGQVSQPQTTWDDTPRTDQPLPTDVAAMRNYTENYSYDPVGNILNVVHQAKNGNWTRTYGYDEPNVPPRNNRLTSTTVGSVRYGYLYDADGNMTQMSSLLMTWDFKDQLASTHQQVVNDGTPPTTLYVYDSSGQRVRKMTLSSTGSRIKERIYLGGYEIYREYGSDGTTVTLERQTLHVVDEKRRIALVETQTTDTGVPSSAVPTPILRYQFSNHLDSACLELDGSAAIISYEEYYPYGSTSFQAVSGSIEVSAKRYRYTGKERDEESGLYYYGARYYASWIGRWTACDPIGIGDGLNVFAYGANNPVRWIDPSGRQNVQPKAGTAPPTVTYEEVEKQDEYNQAGFAMRQQDNEMRHQGWIIGVPDKVPYVITHPKEVIEATQSQPIKDRTPVTPAPEIISPVLRAVGDIASVPEKIAKQLGYGDLVQPFYDMVPLGALGEIGELGPVLSQIRSGLPELVADTRGSLRIPGSITSGEQQLAKLADRLVPASAEQTEAMNLAYEETIAVGETKQKAGDVAHRLLGAKGSGEGIDYGISLETGALEPVTLLSDEQITGVIMELKTHWGGPMETREFTKTAEQLSEASRAYQLSNPGGFVPLQLQRHLYRNPATGEVLRLTK